jgi:hypothetical protein
VVLAGLRPDTPASCWSTWLAAVVEVAASGPHLHIVLVPWWLILVALIVWRRRLRQR